MRSLRYLSLLVLLLFASQSLPVHAATRTRDDSGEGRFHRLVRVVKKLIGVADGDTLIIPSP